MAHTNSLLFRVADLGEGLRLHFHSTRAFKTITARLVLHANLDDMSAARALVPRILSRGTWRLPDLRSFQVELDLLYGASLDGDARRIGERQLIQFRSDWILDRLAGEPLLERMGKLMAEYLHDPAGDPDGGLRAEVFERERKIMLDEARTVFDDKARYARHRLLEEMCRGEAFARPAIGRIDEIEALTLDGVRRAHRGLIERAPAELFLVGDLTWRDAQTYARRLRLHRRKVTVRLRRTTHRRAGRARTVREQQDVGQAKLEMGFRFRPTTDVNRYAAMVIMNTVFGGSPVAKLFRNVREKESLCYSIGSSLDRTKGILLVHAGIDEANYARTRRLILAQLEALRKGRMNEEERTHSRGLLSSGLRALRDSANGLINYALERSVNRVPADVESFIAAIERVTNEDVARAARAVELDTVYLLQGARA